MFYNEKTRKRVFRNEFSIEKDNVLGDRIISKCPPIIVRIETPEKTDKFIELSRNFFCESKLDNYVKLDYIIYGRFTPKSDTFYDIDSENVTKYLRKYNTFYISDNDLLEQIINFLPENINTLIFGENIKKSPKFTLPKQIKNIITFSPFIFSNTINVDTCVIYKSKITDYPELNMLNLTAKKILYYSDISDYKNTITIPVGTETFVYHTNNTTEIKVEIPESLKEFICTGNIDTINRIPIICCIRGTIRNISCKKNYEDVSLISSYVENPVRINCDGQINIKDLCCSDINCSYKYVIIRTIDKESTLKYHDISEVLPIKYLIIGSYVFY